MVVRNNKYIRIVNLIFKTLFLLSILTAIFLTFYKPPLPGHFELLPEIKNSPEQEQLSLDEIEVGVKDLNYTLNPRYTYKIYGLVVSLYDSDNWLDITHKNDPKNVRDLCVVWGENALNSDYQKVKYKSGEFTCFARWKSSDLRFNFRDISNNHIIPETEKISQITRDVRIGDQIYIEGYLADYTISLSDGTLISKRSTSTTREDTGNGACETLYVKDIQILKRGNVEYYTAKTISRHSVWIIFLVWILFNVLKNQYINLNKKRGKA